MGEILVRLEYHRGLVNLTIIEVPGTGEIPLNLTYICISWVNGTSGSLCKPIIISP